MQSWGKFWEIPKASYPNPVWDTGETYCASGASGDQTMLACPQPVFGQDGDSVNIPNARSFTGPTGHASFTSDYTTRDNLRGLVWTSCIDGITGADCTGGAFNGVNFSGATAVCQGLNSVHGSSGYGGISDWRLPTIEELQTLVNVSGTPGTLDVVNFPPVGTGDSHWSSTTSAQNSANAMSIDFADAGQSPIPKTNTGVTRCVSGAKRDRGPYSNNGDGTITDQSNGLVWQRCPPGQANDAACSGAATPANWVTAISYCQSLSLAGKKWRLPNINELFSLSAFTNSGVAIDAAAFSGTAAAAFWSSTSLNGGTTNSYLVNFADGLATFGTKSTTGLIRCVTGPE